MYLGRKQLFYSGECVGKKEQVTQTLMSNDNPREPHSPFGGGELFHLMVESVRDYAIFAISPEGRIISWNTGAELIFGYREEEAVGQSAGIIFTPEDREGGAPQEELRKAAEEGRAERVHGAVAADAPVAGSGG